MKNIRERFEQALKGFKSEFSGSEADLVDNLLELQLEFCKEYNNYNIGVMHPEAFEALDTFLLDCEWIMQDEREDIMERLVLVKEEE